VLEYPPDRAHRTFGYVLAMLILTGGETLRSTTTTAGRPPSDQLYQDIAVSRANCGLLKIIPSTRRAPANAMNAALKMMRPSVKKKARCEAFRMERPFPEVLRIVRLR